MTTHKEALTLARQLLWRYRHETPIGNQPHMICQEVDEAFKRIDEALAQPEQEPVAWGVIASNTKKMCQVELDFAEVEEISPKWVVPLYTTPPYVPTERQRKPLTDEQYFEIGQRHWLPINKIEQIHKEIEEAAHGIKEKNT